MLSRAESDCEVEQRVVTLRGASVRKRVAKFAAAVGAACAIVLGAVGIERWRFPMAAAPSDDRSFLRAQQYPTSAPELGAALVPRPKHCVRVPGVKLAETAPVPIWSACSAKWSEDCSATGCCQDHGMTCYQKNDGWSACMESCDDIDSMNESWTCKDMGLENPHSDKMCQEACSSLATCAVAIYNSDSGGSCSISVQLQHEVVWAADNFVSHICTDPSSKEEVNELLEKVHQQLPFTNGALELENCSWAGEDCSQTRCCNDYDCDRNFMHCQPYTCYQKSPYFSSCRKDAPPDSWDGAVLGGGRTHRSLAPAGSQVALQGTSLYCFSVVNWAAPPPQPFWSSEADLAKNIRENGVGIMQCDDHDWFDGSPTAKAEWGSFSNIDAFQHIWKMVGKKGTWKKHDFIVKVDADAVFFPTRLKAHIEQLRVPRGSRVYFENIGYRFNFMGALEVLSNAALDLYLARSQECIRGKHEGGEDFFMKGCMDALGIDHMADHMLLHDRYASQDDPCTDGWTVAYHFHKKVISWNWCYNEAVCGGRAKSCPQGIEVEYVMPWTPPPPTTTTVG